MRKSDSQSSEKNDDASLNRRKKQRIPIESRGKQPEPTLHINGDFYPCTIVNISIGGLCLGLKEPFEPDSGSIGYISLESETSDQNTRHRIFLRWIEQVQDGKLAGFEFSDSESKAYESIRPWLDQPVMEEDELTGMH
ncbi:PilZ domain-containing protein [Cyanobium sp. T1G-Tous]|uniref:PilZ domain-containing protein n=1 Tax=Cyanobium sp. T1G-Tous TaxID=2823722 RepID=UPI0020CD6C37|nr:PilZ domain-containing protein [Cyanobium sp. T1G-Tous]